MYQEEFRYNPATKEENELDQDPRSICLIDEETCQALELIINSVERNNKRDTLIGFLDRTCTTTGYRMLKNEILQPLAHVNTLELRLDCVEYFTNRCDSYALIYNELTHFGRGVDLDKLVPDLVTLATRKSENVRIAEKRLEILGTLCNLVSRVPHLLNVLEGVDIRILEVYKNALKDSAYSQIYSDILDVLDLNNKNTNKNKRNRVLCIKYRVNDLFDIARATYQEALNNVQDYVSELQQVDRLPWKLTYAESKGYLLALSLDKLPKGFQLPSKYIRVVVNRLTITCTTHDMMRSNNRANVSYENSMKLANEILVGLLETILGNVGAINKLVEIVGRIDMLSSLTKMVIDNSNYKYVRPRFSKTETLIQKPRHPVLETILHLENQQFIPNDIFLSMNNGNFCLVTGPNMGGKSVYIKQTALVQIMAQIGSFVPANSAVVRPVNRIVVRIGSSDDCTSSCSSFMNEMKGIATALNGSNSLPTLFAIDEVGRGTSVDDGTAYSFAIAEELASNRENFTMFATHFSALLNLPKLMNGVKVFQFKIESDVTMKTKFLSHILLPGFSDKCHYGIELAESCGLPRELVEEAKSMFK